jgi:hypothetical protein
LRTHRAASRENAAQRSPLVEARFKRRLPFQRGCSNEAVEAEICSSAPREAP